jgi:hypothetical protein
MGLNFLIKFYRDLIQDISILMEDKKYTNKKAFIKDLQNLEPSLIISVIFSQIFSFCFRYKDLTDQPVT